MRDGQLISSWLIFSLELNWFWFVWFVRSHVVFELLAMAIISTDIAPRPRHKNYPKPNHYYIHAYWYTG